MRKSLEVISSNKMNESTSKMDDLDWTEEQLRKGTMRYNP